MSDFSGQIQRITYRAENGFTVAVLLDDDGDELIITGKLIDVDKGQFLKGEGEDTVHPVYGPQISVRSYQTVQPQDIESIERYLASGAIKGIGLTMAKRIIKKFGDDTMRIIDEEPERLAEIRGISGRMARDIASQIQEKKGMRKALMYLQSLEITPALSAKIYERYGDGLFEVIGKNPYQLVEDIRGVGFATADMIASRAGVLPDSHFRICSAILYVLSTAQGDGHMYLPEPELMELTQRLLNESEAARLYLVEEGDLDICLRELISQEKVFVRETGTGEGVFLTWCYFTEIGCASLIRDMDLPTQAGEEVLDAQIKEIEQSIGMELDGAQRDALIMAAGSCVGIITGGPGTGKTTIIKMLLAYYERNGMDVLLAAPTGRAAKRMSEATGYEAATIHRLLEINGEEAMRFSRNADNPLETDVVILDEMSMVDIFLFHALLKAMTPGMRLIMVGDENQLPSVGPGSVLADLIESGCVRVARLDRIFRQEEQSDIVINAHRINRGEEITLDNKSPQFCFLQKDDTANIVSIAAYLLTDKLPGYLNVRSEEIQVMTPMRKGSLGVENLNRLLQEKLNPPEPGKEEQRFGDTVFREGDKVMQIKNNYQMPWTIRSKKGIAVESGEGVYNGDMGRIISISKSSRNITVRFDDDKEVDYTPQMLEELELSYAITVHKSQGSEYPAVIIPLLAVPHMLMNRNLLYTAVTRARSCVVLLGRKETVYGMIANVNEKKRNTALAVRIRAVYGQGE